MTSSHFLANLLHPVYRGKKLLAAHTNAAHEYFLEYSADLLPDLLNFSTDSLDIPNSLMHEAVISKTKSTVWWKCLEKSNAINKDLCELAYKLMAMPASSASIERVFSNFGLIQSKLRNRLGVQKAAKLVACYRILRGKEELDW